MISGAVDLFGRRRRAGRAAADVLVQAERLAGKRVTPGLSRWRRVAS